jgi:hypothetical protein
MSRCLIAILIFDELKAVAGECVEAVDTGPIVTPRRSGTGLISSLARCFR